MGTGKDKKTYCRWHEVEHLRPTAEIHEINRRRLGEGLEAVGECWRPLPRFNPLSHKEPKGGIAFDVEGSNGKALWPYHRVVWDLLMGGHPQRRELDHLTGCIVGASCCSPAHLEPVHHTVNMARRKARNAARKNRKTFNVATCGPAVNKKALLSEDVRKFAQDYDLPLPETAR